MTELERLTAEIMLECEQDGEPVTAQEAEEMARMELGEKAVKRYEKADKPRKPSTRERKVDPTKKHLIGCIRVLLEGLNAQVTPLTNETDLHFTYNGESYSVKLTKHRPPKK